MPPERIRVKLVSEAAEYVTVSHVMQRDYVLPELVQLMLPVIGRDAERIRRILQIGTISTGDYRYRWERLEVGPAEVESVLGTLPGPDPSRSFESSACFLVRFRRGLEVLDLPQEWAARKSLFARQSFWEALLGLAQQGIQYADYSHAEQADVFVLPLGAEGKDMLHALLPLLRSRSAAERLQQLQPDRIEWLLRR